MDLTTALITAFIISFVGNALPFFGEAYTIYASLLLLGLGASPCNTLAMVMVTAVGAAVSKNVSYALGYALKRPLRKTSAVRLIGALSNKAPLWILVIALAAIPGLPLDDYLYIGAGAAIISPLKLNTYVLVGKVIKSSVEIPIELLLFSSIYTAFKYSTGLSLFQVVTAVIFTALAVVIFRIDWVRIYAQIQDRIPYLPRINIDEF
jgi:membrane protein YqaA with SNARE-associated domain